MAFRIRSRFFCAALLLSAFACGVPSALPRATASDSTAPTPELIHDDRFGWEFSYSVSISKTDGNGPRVIVHYQTIGDGARAEQTARLFTRLMRLHKEHFGVETAFFHDADKADVWLAGQRPVSASDGGETRQNQMYLFGIHDARRTKLEWTRTLVHEWGHLTLPAARGYTDPETDASGYLGERLYMKWLREDTPPTPAEFVSAAATPDGTSWADLDLYYSRQIAPLMARFNRPATQGGGPDAPVLRQLDTRAMDGYIGAVCACDTAWGSPLVGRALFSIQGTTALDFFVSARTVWAQSLTGTEPIPLHFPAWIPLTKGVYGLKTEKIVKNFTVPAPTWKWLDGTGTGTLLRVTKP